MNGHRLLVLYSAVLTVGVAVAMASGAVASQGPANARFDTIDVKRINVVEDDGTTRMIVSNTSRSPGIIFRGKETPHPSGNRGAGIIFYNNEGTENGGLTFGGGKGPDGKVRHIGHLSFDQYEQDQVIQLTQEERDGRRWAAMVVSDRPDTPLDIGLGERLAKMPDGPEKQALIRKLRAEGVGGRQRLFVGKGQEKESTVMLSDGLGRPRIVMKVSADGEAKIDFLDEKGAIVRSLTPAAG